MFILTFHLFLTRITSGFLRILRVLELSYKIYKEIKIRRMVDILDMLKGSFSGRKNTKIDQTIAKLGNKKRPNTTDTNEDNDNKNKKLQLNTNIKKRKITDKKAEVDDNYKKFIQEQTPPNSSPVSSQIIAREVEDDANEDKESATKPIETSAPASNYKQLHFKSSTKRTVCPKCQMQYIPHLKLDKNLHDKFHQRAMEGLPIGYSGSNNNSMNYFGKLIREVNIRRPSSTMISKNDKEYSNGRIVEVNVENQKEVNLAKEFLNIVNTELNAPEAISQWLKGFDFGKVFLFIVNDKAVGLCSIERIQKKEKNGYWMIHESGDLVPNQRINLIVGISRIYVSHEYRRLGIGLELLQAVAENSVYGLSLKKWQIGWSQPSEFGGKLAVKFNGVKHKSGKILIPVYKEEEQK